MADARRALSLYKAYEQHFRIGAAINSWKTDDPAYRELICNHFNSFTAENEMKPAGILNREGTLRIGDGIHTAQDYTRVDKLLSFARDNGIRVRFHVLCWHNQTPVWFFTEGWEDIPFKQLIENGFNAPFVAGDVMLKRQEAYIRDVMKHVNTCFPGVVYAWDVVNEAIDPDKGDAQGLRTWSPWYKTVGSDEFIMNAFRTARRYQAPGQLLFYNDYSCYDDNKLPLIKALLQKLKAEDLVDGMGMQGHLMLEYPPVAKCEQAARAYAALGLSLQVTELDIHCPDGSTAGQKALAEKYGAYFGMLVHLHQEGIDINSVTFWGLTDKDSWLPGFRRSESYPLLFTGEMETKPAYDAVIAAAGKTEN